jgi:hypothetical protein
MANTPSRTKNTVPNNKGSVSFGWHLPSNFKGPEGAPRPSPSSSNIPRERRKVSRGFALGFDWTGVTPIVEFPEPAPPTTGT